MWLPLIFFMQLKLRQVQIGIHSEETLDYKARLFINGRHVAHVSNTGQGEMTNISLADIKYKALLKEAEAYVQTLPPYHTDDKELFPNGIPWALDFWCDMQAEKTKAIQF